MDFCLCCSLASNGVFVRYFQQETLPCKQVRAARLQAKEAMAGIPTNHQPPDNQERFDFSMHEPRFKA